jgi:hypothetical protein
VVKTDRRSLCFSERLRRRRQSLLGVLDGKVFFSSGSRYRGQSVFQEHRKIEPKGETGGSRVVELPPGDRKMPGSG